MLEKKKLSDEELEDVSGGSGCHDDNWAEYMSEYLPASHGQHIGKGAAPRYIGRKVFAVFDGDREEYYWGTLKWSDGDEHIIHVDGYNPNYRKGCCFGWVGEDHYFEGDNNTLFLYN